MTKLKPLKMNDKTYLYLVNIKLDYEAVKNSQILLETTSGKMPISEIARSSEEVFDDHNL